MSTSRVRWQYQYKCSAGAEERTRWRINYWSEIKSGKEMENEKEQTTQRVYTVK